MNTPAADTAALYRAHVHALQARTESLLAPLGFDALAIASGIEKFAFLDDRPYVFQPNPHFVHWVPLNQHPGSWLLVRPGAKPLLVYLQPEDYWHAVPEAPAGYWVDAFEIAVVRTPEAAEALLNQATQGQRLAVIGEADAAQGALVPNNPQGLIDALHFARAYKSPYELAQMRAASRIAVRGHRAAQAAFEAGESEAGIHAAYLQACGVAERQLPYGNIVGLGAHAAVLHWQHQDREAPAVPTSFLIDAGAGFGGYAADITRTYLHPQAAGAARDDFAALLAGMEALELALVDQVRDGTDYVAIHLDAHRRIAQLLLDTGLLRNLSAEAAVAQGVSRVFFPHGIGHLLGLQVHDVAGLAIDAQGTRRERPAGHPYLRLTRPLAEGMVVTIEPGLYFIPMLLQELAAAPEAAHVDWARVEALKPYGGIRIEDDVACRAGDAAPENFTRDAFAGLQP